ncbi:unnamed protein product, partial [Closterium sp. NIES-53]
WRNVLPRALWVRLPVLLSPFSRQAVPRQSRLDGSLSSLFLAVGVGLPCTVMQCGDVIYRSTLAADDQLRLTVGGVLLLVLLGTYMWATPGVVPGFFDMFVYGPIERKIRPQLRKVRCTLAKKVCFMRGELTALRTFIHADSFRGGHCYTH